MGIALPPLFPVQPSTGNRLASLCPSDTSKEENPQGRNTNHLNREKKKKKEPQDLI